MIRSILAFAILFFGYAAQFTEAQAARRMALVIGINDYEYIPKLEKAVGDVEAMGEKLRSLGFDVTSVINPNRRTMNIAIGKFTARLAPGDTAFVHFSGHGVEIDGDNFLLPRDIPKPEDGQKDTVKYEAIGLRRLISQFKATGARARVFVIDACRDNPFEQTGVRSVGATRGLTRIVAPAGNFIMYSAGYRQLALDRLGPDDFSKTSVYTRVLLSRLGTPGMSIADIARDVRNEVQTIARGIGHVQRPAYYDELSSSLVLVPDQPKPLAEEKKKPEIVALGNFPVNNLQGSSDKQIELLYWNEVKDLNSVDALQSYLAQYPSGSFAPLAHIRIKALKRAEAEAARVKAEELARLAAEKKEKQKGEQVKTASLTQPSEEGGEQRPKLRKRELALRIQEELNRIGCSVGRPDGVWGRGSRRGLGKYISRSDSDIISLQPSMELLGELEGVDERVCVRVVEPKREKKNEATKRKKSKKQLARERRKREAAKKTAAQKRKERARRAAERKRKRARKKQARAKTATKRKRRSSGRVLVGQGNSGRPSRRRRVCADRERSLCAHDN